MSDVIVTEQVFNVTVTGDNDLDVVTIGMQGPEGPAHTTYTHTQSIPSDTWIVQHVLGRHPSVSVVDSAGSVVVGNVTYDSDIQVTITFSASFSGKAYLN